LININTDHLSRSLHDWRGCDSGCPVAKTYCLSFYPSDNGTFVTKWGSEGEGDGQFSKPESIDVDRFGLVYVADTSNNNVQCLFLIVERLNSQVLAGISSENTIKYSV